MHILFLSDNFSPEVNASASRVYERACYWVKWGHQVTVITCAPNFPQGKVYSGYKNKWYQVEMMDGIRVIRVKTFIAKNSGFLLRIIDFLSFMLMAFFAGLFQKKPDVIVATSPQFFTAVAGWALAGVKRKPFIFELSDLWPASIIAVGAMRKSFLIRRLEKLELFLYRRATAIVALTQAFKDDLISRGIAAEKISVVINGVDLQRFHSISKPIDLIEKYSLQNKFIFGYMGTHGMAHDLMNVLNAAELLKDKDICFLLVGDGAEREMLMDNAKQRGLQQVIFIPPQKKSDMNKYWSLCDIALVHLKNDPVFSTVIPSKIFEAMAMKLPILLVAPQGEASEIIEMEDVGLWIPAGNPEIFAKTVEHLATNKIICETLAQRSYHAASRYSREFQAKSMLEVMQKHEEGGI